MANGAKPQAELELRPVAPFRLDLTVWALRRRRRNRLDRWDGTYRRALDVGTRAITVEVAQRGSTTEPTLVVSNLTGGRLSTAERMSVETQLGRLLRIDADLTEFSTLAASDPRLGRLADRMSGIKPPRFTNLFEAFVNAIANQQLSLEVGIELLNRFTEAFGARPPGDHGLVAFPNAESILAVPITEIQALGFSTRKAEYVLSCAHAVATGAIDETTLESLDRAAATEELTALRGIGRWSAEYVLLRGLGRIDVFPADDVGARNKLERFFGLPSPPDRDEILRLLAPWNPVAGMIYFHLLLDGLADAGDVDA
jgi:DNA-3-methyladenine glycosylase II